MYFISFFLNLFKTFLFVGSAVNVDEDTLLIGYPATDSRTELALKTLDLRFELEGVMRTIDFILRWLLVWESDSIRLPP
jgi:hypothetical protein